MSFQKALNNKIILYVFSRYAVYIIQFINSLFIAVFLGPYYLGIWGFITLILSYFKQFDFGISHSVNAIISINKSDADYVERVVGTSLTMLSILAAIVGVLFIMNFTLDFNLGEKYSFATYGVLVCITGIISFYNSLFARVFRVHGRVTEMAFNQSVFPILMLVVLLVCKGEKLLWGLVGANFIAYFVSLLLYLYRSPIKLKFIYDKKLWKLIQIKGWHLFVYNTSFYLIIISTRTIVSMFYRVEEFGYFTFAFSLASIYLLLLDSFSSLIYPKFLNRIANSTHERTIEILTVMRNSYITLSHLLLHIAIFVVPLFLVLFPKYATAGKAFHLIALAIVLNSNSYGYSGLLIAKGKEKKLGLISFIIFILNVISVVVLVKVFEVSYEYAIVGTMLSYLIYIFFVGHMGRKQMNLTTGFSDVARDIFPQRLMIPYILSLVVSVFAFNDLFLIVPLALFIILNLRTVLGLKPLVRSVTSNSKSFDI